MRETNKEYEDVNQPLQSCDLGLYTRGSSLPQDMRLFIFSLEVHPSVGFFGHMESGSTIKPIRILKWFDIVNNQ